MFWGIEKSPAGTGIQSLDLPASILILLQPWYPNPQGLFTPQEKIKEAFISFR
jgi:hypothetical protein